MTFFPGYTLLGALILGPKNGGVARVHHLVRWRCSCTPPGTVALLMYTTCTHWRCSCTPPETLAFLEWFWGTLRAILDMLACPTCHNNLFTVPYNFLNIISPTLKH